jgi:hypothetical protein
VLIDVNEFKKHLKKMDSLLKKAKAHESKRCRGKYFRYEAGNWEIDQVFVAASKISIVWETTLSFLKPSAKYIFFPTVVAERSNLPSLKLAMDHVLIILS